MDLAPPGFILASTSPRRREMLAAAGFNFKVVAPQADEANHSGLGPRELALALATEKALSVSRAYPQAVVLGADTLVAQAGWVMGKPADAAEALAMLAMLSGREHEVLTGFCLAQGGATIQTEVVATRVLFRVLSKAELVTYAESGLPLDKAGAYGIQDLGGGLVKAVFGSYTNVVGLPLAEVLEALDKAGVRPAR